MDLPEKEASIRLNGTNQGVVVLAIRGASIEGFPCPTEDETFVSGTLPVQARKAEQSANTRRNTWPTANVHALRQAAKTDLFYLEARKLARELSRVTGFKVIVGFTGCGSPTLEEALEQAFTEGAEKIVLVDPEKYCYG